jgi:hypothetical protein
MIYSVYRMIRKLERRMMWQFALSKLPQSFEKIQGVNGNQLDNGLSRLDYDVHLFISL